MALFKNTEDFKRVVPTIHKNFNWEEELKPIVEQITALYVAPYLSKAELDSLEEAYLTDGLSEAQQAIIDDAQRAIGYYTYLDMHDSYQLQIAGAGVTQTVGDNFQAAPISAIDSSKRSAANKADAFLDAVLQTMEASPASYTSWKNSDSYTLLYECFIPSITSLNRYLLIGDSRRVYTQIKASLLWVQERDLLPLLGDTFYQELLSQSKPDGTLSTANTKVITYIQKLLAFSGFYEAMPSMIIQYINGGIHFRSYLNGSPQFMKSNDNAVRLLRKQMAERGIAAKTALTKFLDENATDYPNYTATAYLLSDGKVSYQPPNNKNKKSFRV